MSGAPIVIIGAGHAGVQLAASLREEGFAEPVVLLSAGPDLPYQRPQLSKAYLKADEDSPLPLRAETFFRDHAIDLRLGETAVSIERPEARVRLASGDAIPYSRLVLACGARARPFVVDGRRIDNVVILRNLADARDLKQRLRAAGDVGIVGAGFIGLEIAATAAAMGKRVTIVEIGERVMGRAVSPPLSDFFAGAHEAFGAKLVLRTGVARLHERGGAIRELELSDGARVPVDLLVAGVGVLAEDAVAVSAGLRTEDGIVVDDHLRTADPAISAVGDCATFPGGAIAPRLRLESVQNAVDQARCVARRLAGKPEAYRSLPWFWSDQGDLKLQIAGLSRGVDRWVLRGAPDSRAFAVFGFRGEEIAVVETVNRPGDHMAARKIFERGAALSPQEAADPAFDLRQRALGKA